MIEVKNLQHIYSPGLPDETVALDQVSFTVEDGEFVGIIGHTGSGKTTLIQHLNGLEKPTDGSIVIDGLDLSEKGVRLTDIRKKIGLVFQYPEYQLFEQTVALDIAFGPRNLGLEEKEIEERVRWALDEVGLSYEEFGEKSPFDLSGGEKRRVAIAGVLAMKPDILILDEPTAGLDPKAHQEVLQMVRRLHENRNITIMISHNMKDVAELCDRVLVIDKGRLVMNDTPEKVFSRADELKRMGLDIPPAAGVMHRLAAGGMDVNLNCFNAKDAAEEIIRCLEI